MTKEETWSVPMQRARAFFREQEDVVEENANIYVFGSCRITLTELKPKGITVTAVCPGPMETEFIHLGGIKGQSRTFDILPYCDQVRVAGGALRAARAGRTIYTPTLFYKFYRVLAKVTPVKLMVKFTKT